MLEDAAGIRRVVVACGYVNLRKGLFLYTPSYLTLTLKILLLIQEDKLCIFYSLHRIINSPTAHCIYYLLLFFFTNY